MKKILALRRSMLQSKYVFVPRQTKAKVDSFKGNQQQGQRGNRLVTGGVKVFTSQQFSQGVVNWKDQIANYAHVGFLLGAI